MPSGRVCGADSVQGASCAVATSEASALGTYVGRLLQTQPTQAMLDEFAKLRPAFEKALAAISGPSAACAGEALGDVTLDRVNDDYINLFVGLGSVKAAPWGSVYASDERLVFQPETLEVRAWYRRFGSEPAKLGSEPDDHIGTELEFLGGLLAVDGESARTFALQQPGRWVRTWAALVHEHATCGFYPLLADAAIAVVELAAHLTVPKA